jgi:hypothetical protein
MKMTMVVRGHENLLAGAKALGRTLRFSVFCCLIIGWNALFMGVRGKSTTSVCNCLSRFGLRLTGKALLSLMEE